MDTSRGLLDISRTWKVTVTLLVLLVAAASAFIVVVWNPYLLISWLSRCTPAVLFFSHRRDSTIALTIDDGPTDEWTAEILRILNSNAAHATFFIIGDRVSGRESLLKQIISYGHEIGNHLLHDEHSMSLSEEEFERQLLQTDSLLRPFQPSRWFRPGSGWYTDRMLRVASHHGFRCVLGSVYPFDPILPYPSYLVRHILANVRPGSIIILHDGAVRGGRTAAVLKEVLPRLRARGFNIVTVSALLASTS